MIFPSGNRNVRNLQTTCQCSFRVEVANPIETTNAYVPANLAMKEKALAKVQPMDTPFRRFHADGRLLAFLESI